MLDKNSSKYSDRPTFTMTGKLVGCEHILAFLPPGPRLREARRQFHRIIGTHAAVQVFHAIQIAETHNFLKRVYEAPERFLVHIRRYARALAVTFPLTCTYSQDGWDCNFTYFTRL